MKSKLTILLGLTGAALCQTTSVTLPAFEVADVRVSPPTRNPFFREPAVRHGRYEIRDATMVDLIRTAYGIDAERVLGGPNWLENDLFDVIAKVPPGTTTETAKPMLKTLLTERFALTLHNDMKAIPAYGLKAGKHPQMKESDGSADSGCKFVQPTPTAGGSAALPPVFGFTCRNMTMEALVGALHTSIFLAPPYLNSRLVVDQTDLKGAWDFDLKFTPKNMRGPDGPMTGAVTLFDAVDKQLGLKLEMVDTPLPVIVVDKVNQAPTANAPDSAEALHIMPPPTEFDVAELKPSPPDFRGMRLNFQPGGRVNIAGATVKFLIEQAWDVSDDMLAGAPKWMDSDRYDIVAKAAAGERDVDIDELWPMLRALLTERFQLRTHLEDRPGTAFTLTALKPRMAKADPASRTKCHEGPGPDGKDPRDKNPVLSRLLTCQNMTMAQFADKLKSLASGYVHSPVLDSTELPGGYNFTLSFSTAGATRAGGGRGGEAAGAGEASDPNGAITLPDAVEKQLGLKMEAQKRPVKVLVIDRAEQKPTEN